MPPRKVTPALVARSFAVKAERSQKEPLCNNNSREKRESRASQEEEEAVSDVDEETDKGLDERSKEGKENSMILAVFGAGPRAFNNG